MTQTSPRTEPRTGDTPLLSIVVPFYNVEAYIGDCLDSLRQQLLEDVEVILVDDGSTDASLAVAETFLAADPRFRLVRQSNQGLGPARNTGTREARGRYLTFVDSDDLVAPRAYTLMVGSLERTGSAFAAGNAYRFSAHKGVYQSWTHREPFRATKLRTSLDRHVALVKDRMVWNKVFRRTFWDANGYLFPAMRYEDYPVTLRAYLEAESVDIMSTHVYLWRDRESGDSITQQAANADNARERFESARMVLDVLAHHEASDRVRATVQGYFIHIDLVSLAQSMVSVPEADRPELERMTLELARLLPPRADDATRLARLIHRRLLAGDVQTARQLASWRLSGDTRSLARNLARKPLALPPALGAVLRRNRIQNPMRPRRLRSALVGATWDGPFLRLTVETKLRGDLARRVGVSAVFSRGKRKRLRRQLVSLPVRVRSSEATASGLVLELELDSRTAQQLPASWGHGTLTLELRLAALSWVGQVRFTPDLVPGAHQLSDGTWLQLRGVGLYLGVALLRAPVVVERVEAVGSAFVVHPSRSTTGTTLVVHRPDPTPDIPLVFGAGPLTVTAAQLLAGDPPDNPVTRVAERRVALPAGPAMPPLWLPEGGRPDNVPPDMVYESVYLVGDGATIRVGETDVALERGWYGNLVVRQGPVVSAPGPEVVDAPEDTAVEAVPEEVVAAAEATTDAPPEAEPPD